MTLGPKTVVDAFRVHGAGGVHLHGQRVMPRRREGPLPCVVLLPCGMTDHPEAWIESVWERVGAV